ncbi:hypothetical protein Cgig2_014796 [Carnegiea gigantea]|uniref:Uncharacterized protein n=1 Tax=Carnegiea gigantea TaxID=171969 RepID=A0A9Q1L1Z8_9CARY|nr:hypothetical protein Cgig2_014796 [Carnegiea gigantea]
MSLALLQGYSSVEEDEGREERDHRSDNFSDDTDSDNDNDDAVLRMPWSYNPVDAPKYSSGSALPSAIDAFSEISGPPQFLNNSVEDQGSARDGVVHRRGRKKIRDKKDLPAGAIVEAKAQLVGIHERVRSDVEGSTSSKASNQGGASTKDGGSPPSLCLQCGIPKTYSSARGMVCPVCPSSDDAKKKGSTVKDKEKIKRMRGQSSHATWKSETEMQLRQQFD